MTTTSKNATDDTRPPAGASDFDVVIFDLDGVLVDSEIWWDEVRESFAADHGRAWTAEDRAAVMGANSRQWSATMRQRLELDIPDQDIERAIVEGVVRRFHDEGPPVIPGAVDAVHAVAAHHPVAVASSAHRAVIDAALAATGLSDAFAVVVSSDEVEHGKPEPDVYLEAARRLGVEPGRCLVVEDSLNGIRAAAAAGMTVVLVPNRSIPPADGATEQASAVLDDLGRIDPVTLRFDTGSGAAPAAPPETPPAAPEAPEPPEAPEAPEATPATPSARGARSGSHDALPLSEIAGWRRTVRYWLSRLLVAAMARCYVRFRVEGRDRLPDGPAVYCFNHMSWTDPFMLMATLPMRPRLYFFGPKEEDMGMGGRNRIMMWTGSAVPYKPGKNDLLGATRRVDAVLGSGAVIGIAGEGRIHDRESELLPLNEGTAYFALRAGVPVVPIAINGTSWLRLGRTIRIRIGEPIATGGRPTREAIASVTDRTWTALHDLLADAPDLPVPGPFGRWFTEVFNDWPDGSRPERPGSDAA